MRRIATLLLALCLLLTTLAACTAQATDNTATASAEISSACFDCCQ